MIKAKTLRTPKDFGPIIQKVHALPAKFRAGVYKEAVPAIQRYARQLTSRYPGRVSVPFIFATPKSRRWYFANKSAPYRRTRVLGQGWNIGLRVSGRANLSITMYNDVNYAEHVYGPRQVPGHANTGWRPLDDIYLRVSQYADNQVRKVMDKTVE